ncbi:MAG: protein translocase subunit SecF [Candidatus Pacearchaeota archaeon]|nr:protein translocase subunit SecF [Candidatus Pacearchaeota archaeon]
MNNKNNTVQEEQKEEKIEKGMQEDTQQKEKKLEEKPQKFSSEWYDKNYKLLLLVSIASLIFSLAVLGITYARTGNIIKKDVTLTGGTIITIHTSEPYDLEELAKFLQKRLGESVIVRRLQDITTGKQIGIFIESKSEASNLKKILEEYLKFSLTEENSSVEIISPALSRSFYKELTVAVFVAFLFMSVVVFFLFKKIVPCFAVILAAATDILGALALANIFGFSISTAGISALLMLIGYSVDTDIMLTTKILKRREDPLNKRIKSAFKTGVTMTLTSFFAVVVSYFIVTSDILKQIFFILAAGLFFDLIATWLGNASILKWYCEKKNIN